MTTRTVRRDVDRLRELGYPSTPPTWRPDALRAQAIRCLDAVDRA